MENEELIQILNAKKEWLKKNIKAVAAKSNHNKFVLDKATDTEGLFLKFIEEIGVPIESEDEKLAFEELRKFSHHEYQKGRVTFILNYYTELSSLISHFIHQILSK